MTNNNGKKLLVELTDIKKVFFTDEVETHALNNINLSQSSMIVSGHP